MTRLLLITALTSLPALASTPALTPPESLWEEPDSFYDETLDLSQFVVDPELQYPVAAGINRTPALTNPVYSAMESEE